MADEVTATQQDTSAGEGKNTAAETGENTATQTAGERTLTQAEVDQIVKERLAEDRKRREKQAEEEAAKARGEWEKLASERERELGEATTERDGLKQEVESLRSALAEVVTEQKKRLKALDEDLLPLMPEGNPVAQLQWLTRAVAKAEKDQGDRQKRGALPPSGGRNPAGGGNGKTEPTEAERQQAARHYASRF